MSCCSDPKGSCCGQPQALPWFSALCDPVFRGKFLARYGRELLGGALGGGLAGFAALAFADGLGALGPLLGGGWLHFHAGAVLPATVAGSMVLALAPSPWLAASLRAGVCLALGGALNGFLEGNWVPVPVFVVLGLPAIWLAGGGLARAFRRRRIPAEDSPKS